MIQLLPRRKNKKETWIQEFISSESQGGQGKYLKVRLALKKTSVVNQAGLPTGQGNGLACCLGDQVGTEGKLQWRRMKDDESVPGKLWRQSGLWSPSAEDM